MQLNKDFIEEISYLMLGNGLVKVVFITEELCRNSSMIIENNEYKELYNYNEPFDFVTHVFIVPQTELSDCTVILFKTQGLDNDSDYFEKAGQTGECEIVFDSKSVHSIQEQYLCNDSGIQVISENKSTLVDGVYVSDFVCKDRRGAPVRAFMFSVERGKASFFCGTPDNGYDYLNKKQTVEGEAIAACENGVDVLAAVNADFFDMFGDCRPSGLCVKNGIVVANAESDRPFFAVLKNGSNVIGRSGDDNIKTDDILHAVSGRPLILSNGEISDFQPLEPFGFTRHPRTAVGLCADGRVLVLIIDGRIPDYSNGATLLDTALFLKSMGACDALNLDGGGSCTFLVKNGDCFEIKNRPADLFRPADKLIRDVFNSLMIIR